MWLLVIGILAVIGGAAMGWAAFFQLKALKQQVDQLEQKLSHFNTVNSITTTTTNKQTQRTDSTSKWNRPDAVEASQIAKAEPVQVSSTVVNTAKTTPPASHILLAKLKSHWMIILGGVCIGLSGIFLVKYSIDSGLLGPAARIGLAIVLGLSLHGVAEWLRRNSGESNPVFAALAGGASITLYAAFLAAFQLYQLLPSNVVFVFLVFISLATMALSLRHGPMLAIIGLLGGFVVPILLSDGSGNILGAMLYSLIIAGSSLLLMRYVYRSWLWYGMLLGGFGWWWVSTTTPLADNWRGLYLAALVYLILAIPRGDFLLLGANALEKQANLAKTPWWNAPLLHVFNKALSPIETAALLLLAASFWSVNIQPFNAQTLWQWLPLTALVLVVSGSQCSLKYLAWGYLLGQLLSLVANRIYWQVDAGMQIHFISEALQRDFLIFAGMMALTFSCLGALNQRKGASPHLWASLVFLSPLLWLALSYLLVSDLSRSLTWSTVSIVLGFTYLAVATWRFKRSANDVLGIWLVFAGHAGYSLAAAMFFREAGLTLVLAVQLVSLAALIKHFQLSGVDWLFKVILAVIIARLTFNPWLLTYPEDIHWSLWTYGGCTLLAVIACYQMREYSSLHKWLEAATLHLLVLTLGAESRYWLYDGEIFHHRYSLAEAAINSSLWAALSLCYIARARFAQTLQGLYQLLANILLLLAVVSYFSALTWLNPLWSSETVSNRPIFNLLLLAYGVPVLLAWLVMRFHLPKYQKASALCLGLGLFVFVTIEIRHLWQGDLTLHSATGNGELYTYSVVWMLLAGAAILLAYFIRQRQVYHAGIVLLGLVILKIFLVDMSGLEGLLRVASFMGLGLVLLVLAYLHRFIDFAEAEISAR